LRSLVKALPLLVVALIVLPFASFIAPAHAQTTETGPATQYMIWKGVPLQNAVKALETGTIDAYLFGLSPAAAQQLIGKKGINLYEAAAGYVDILLNPAPVMIVQIPGKVTRDQAAKMLNVNPVVISTLTYIPPNANLNLLNSAPFIGVPINKTDVTIVELCAKPTTPLPSSVKVLRQASYDINPFCFAKIRYAMNYLVDRSYIVKNIYKGLAIAMYAFYGPANPVYSSLVSVLAKYQFSYNPSLARSIVSKVLTEAGAVYKNGFWYYNGKPIKVIGIIRTEDQRLQIGEMFANALQQLGIQVIKEEVTFSTAIPKVYFTDPMDFQWFFYTEGWGSSGLSRWDPWMLAQFAAAWLGWAPGWGSTNYWNYRNATIDFYSMLTANSEINATQLEKNNYYDYLVLVQKGLLKPGEVVKVESKQQWIKYLQEGTELGIHQSIRIWIAATEDVYAARSDVKGVTLDLGAGLANPYFYRTVYIPGKNTVVFGNLHVYTAATIWEPIGGFTDVYSMDPMLATWSPWIWNNPFNGEPQPFRVTYKVITAGPNGKLPVPKDAVWWDAKDHKWVYAWKVGHTEATSEVIIDVSKLVGYKWQDGEPITFADIVTWYAELLDIAFNPVKSSIESSLASTMKSTYSQFVAFEFLPKEKKIVVFINYWHFDPNYIANQAIIPIYVPAPIVLAEDYLAFVKKTYALSDTRARAERIPHLNLVLKSDAEAVVKALEEMSYNMYKSWFTLPNGEVLMTPQEWQQRIQLIKNYVQKYGVAWISDGPFKMIEFNPDADMLKLEAFRNGYPFTPSRFYYGLPTPTQIVQVLAPIVAPGQPATITVMVRGVPPLHVEYVIRDPATGQVVAVGSAAKTPTGFAIELPANVTAKLKPHYAYELEVIAYSDKVAMPAQKTTVLQTTAAVTKEITQLQKTVSSLQKQLSSQAQQISKLASQLQQLSSSVSGSISKIASIVAQLSQSTSKALQTLSSSIATLENKVNSLPSQVSSAVSSAVSQSLSNVATKSQVQTAISKAKAAESRASAALYVAIIDLILLLILIGLVVRKA
jgi:peptide/nickel transport system substrate-binding protein